jgi:predicted GIY-YIG superfamily endonuclease
MLFGISRGRVPLALVLKKTHSYLARAKCRELRRALGMLCVYVVRDGETVLYVGATHYSVIERLAWHVNSGKSPLCALMRAARPAYVSWTVEVFPMPDWPTALRQEKDIQGALCPVL